MRNRSALRGIAAGMLVACSAASVFGDDRYESGLEAEFLSRDGYVWEVGGPAHIAGAYRDLSGFFWFDHDWTENLTWKQYTSGDFNPVSEFSVGVRDNPLVHSGLVDQYYQSDRNGSTEVFFSGGAVGQQTFTLRFYAIGRTDIIQDANRFQIAPEGMVTDTSFDRWGNLVRTGGVWDSVEFIWTDQNGLQQSRPVRRIYKPYFTQTVNDPPELVEARLNGVNGDLVLDEKPGSYTLELTAAATDAQAGTLSFTLDGDGPVDAAATAAGSRRLAHTVTRSISGEDTGDTPHEFLFRVTDPTFGYANWTRTVTVRNLDPILESFELDFEQAAEGDPDTIAPGEILAFAASASDPGRDPLTYDWDLDGDGLYDDHRGDAGWFTVDDIGLAGIGVRVRDGDGGEAVRRTALRVVPEPASAVLMSVAIGALALRRRRG